MIALQQFTGIMTILKEIKEQEEVLNKALQDLGGNKDHNGFHLEKTRALILDLLKYAMGDTEEWIEWWIYEKDWGTSTHLNVSKDGKDIPSTTIEDLYNLIANRV